MAWRDDIPARLRTARAQSGLTQEELAEKVGVATLSVSHYENGRQVPRFEKLEAIAEATGRPLAWFFIEQDGSFQPDPTRTQEALGELDDLDDQLVEARKTLGRARFTLESLATSIVAERKETRPMADRVQEGPLRDDLAARRAAVRERVLQLGQVAAAKGGLDEETIDAAVQAIMAAEAGEFAPAEDFMP